MTSARKPKQTSASRIIAATLLTSFVAAGSSRGAIQTFEWTSTQSGSWFEPANWSPAAIPASEFDTAIIGGSLPLSIDIAGANAIIGSLKLTNPAARLLVKSGRTMSLGFGLSLNGSLTVGEAHPSDYTTLRLGTQSNADVVGTGSFLLNGSAIDPARTQVIVSFGRMSTWSQGILLWGVGSLMGDHRILGTAIANDPAGGALEFRFGRVDGFNSGKLVADGAILRLFQSYAIDATLETRNGGRIELSAPSNAGYISLYRTTVRGNVRCLLNVSGISQTDFEGNLEILAGAAASIDVSSKPFNAHVVVRSNNGAGNSTLTLATGNPLGAGSITLNAESAESQAMLFVDKAVLGGARTLHGQGIVNGNFTLDGHIIADRATGPALLFREGTIDGPGTIEARAGLVSFGVANVLNNLRLLTSDGGRIKLFKIGLGSGSSIWNNVLADVSPDVEGQSILTLNGSVINGSINVVGSTVNLRGAPSAVNGDIFLSVAAPSRGSSLSAASDLSLSGAGKIVMRSPSNTNWSGLFGDPLTLPQTRELHGSGLLSGTLKILGPIFVNDPAGLALWFSGNISGSGENTIEISTGELILSRPGSASELASISSFKVRALPGAKPVKIGDGSFVTGGNPLVSLEAMDIDAQTVISQYKVQLKDSVFRRSSEIRYGVICEIMGTCRFDSSLTLIPSDTDATPIVIVRAPLAAPLSRLLFANRLTGKSGGTLNIAFNGEFNARLEGTGTLNPPTLFNGSVAPSDNSTGSPAGVLFVQNIPLNLASGFVYEADIVSTQSYDRIDSAMGVVANGTLKITMPESVYPPPSFNFHLIRGIATGAFTTVLGPPGYTTTVTYNKAGVLARFEKLCAADLNKDGRVDDEDFALFCIGYDLFACSDPAMPQTCPADLNRDNQVDDTDFVLFIPAYDEMVCP